MSFHFLFTLFILTNFLYSLNNNIEIIDNFSTNQKSIKSSSKNSIEIIDNFYNPPISSDKKKYKNISLKKRAIKKTPPTLANKKNKPILIKKKKKRLSQSKKIYSKPKLVIIIDDISSKNQLRNIKKLPYKITPSIFPPNKANIYNHLLAKNLKHYIIHLPLESYNKQMNNMFKTILISDSYKTMKKRIKEIRKLFPTAKYINNHTGSKFSKNYKASKRLYNILLNYNFVFIDSRTTQQTTFKKISKEFKKRYLHNYLFIDNNKNIAYTINQIKKGINIAKKNGYAIIIGHPHKTTFQALKNARNILNNVDIVYIDEL